MPYLTLFVPPTLASVKPDCSSALQRKRRESLPAGSSTHLLQSGLRARLAELGRFFVIFRATWAGFSAVQTAWRRERDSNPRYPFRYAGFQDRCHQPLGHLSGYYSFTTVTISTAAAAQDPERDASGPQKPRDGTPACKHRDGIAHAVMCGFYCPPSLDCRALVAPRLDTPGSCWLRPFSGGPWLWKNLSSGCGR